MAKTGDEEKEKLLRIAAEVIEGRRDASDLDAHGISLGEPIAGDEAKRMLLAELDKEDQELVEPTPAANRPWWKFWG